MQNILRQHYYSEISPRHLIPNTKGEMEQIQQLYGFSKETITAIMMVYKNTKAMIFSPDGDTNFFNIVAGVLQRNTLTPCMFIIFLGYIL